MSDHATLRDAILYFADFETCKDFMVQLRWLDGVVKCPECGSEKVTWLAKPRVWKCYANHPKPRFSLKTGTIFEDSPIALEKWLPATWMLLNCKNGISSYELGRDLGVTQKTAWFMLSRIRLAMLDDFSGGTLSGEIEVDESFIGGKARNMYKERKLRAINGAAGSPRTNKTVVLGILERAHEGKRKRIRATIIADRKNVGIRPEVAAHVEPGSKIYSDELAHNWKMPDRYEHEIVNHLETYVHGDFHTDSLENFWSFLKRCVGGTSVSAEPFHLFRYVDEQAFRFNNRQMDGGHRLEVGMSQIVGRRLTHKQLIGEAQVAQHG